MRGRPSQACLGILLALCGSGCLMMKKDGDALAEQNQHNEQRVAQLQRRPHIGHQRSPEALLGEDPTGGPGDNANAVGRRPSRHPPTITNLVSYSNLGAVST